VKWYHNGLQNRYCRFDSYIARTMQKQNIVILIILAAAIVVAGTAYQHQRQKAQDIIDDTAVHTVVTQFGANMQKVSLSSPGVLGEIDDAYAAYATSSLIAKWKSNPPFAPGRGLSSPWPDRIDIKSITKNGDGSYMAQGMVDEVTSNEVAHGGLAAEFPLTLTLKKYNGTWLIYDYQAGAETSFLPKTPTTTAP
jgi:hypothetical protein